MLFIILSIASVLTLIVLTNLNSKEEALENYCNLECKKDVTRMHKFCC